MQPQALNFRLCFFMSFLFLGLGVQLPFLPLWLADRGLTTAEIAAVLSGQILIRTFGAPLGAFLADRYGGRSSSSGWSRFCARRVISS